MTASLPDLLAALPFKRAVPFASREWVPHVEPAPTVYRLVAWEGDRPRPLPRAGGVDPHGILDIGESANGLRRLEDLLGAAQGKPRSHRAGWEYAVYDFASAFPLHTLHIEVLPLPSKPLAEALELALLEDYRYRLKDRPPLNGSSGKPTKTANWLISQNLSPRDDEGWLNLGPVLRGTAFPRARTYQ